MDYRSWRIDAEYVGYSGTHPNYDCDCDVDGFFGNGLSVHGMTLDDVRSQIDDKILEMEE